MKKIFICCAVLMTMAFAACSNDDNTVNTDPTSPSFEVVESDEESSDGAWLYAEYDYEGQGTITGAGFAYKIRQSQDEYTKVACDNWDETGVSVQLTGLDPKTEYLYYCYVLIGGKQHNSLAMTFTTAAEGEDPAKPKPMFQKPTSGDYTQTSASLSCGYTYKGDLKTDEAGFFYKKAGDTAYNKVKAAGTTSPIACGLTGLTAGTAYNYYAYLIIGGETYNSTEQTFSTKTEQGEVTPVFGAPAFYNITANAATITCNFSYNDEASKITEVSFRYKTASAADYTKVTLSTAPGDKSTTLNNLTAGTAYTFHLYTVIGGKGYQSAEATFTTQSQQGGGPLAKYAGWPELVPEDKTNSDYHYAYHLCPDLTINGNKARNYTVCFSAKHHCPVWVAAPRHACYEGSANRTNAYTQDPDIPSNIQYKSKSTGGGCNKGHMLGSAERTRSTAINKQVFYYTNIAPQYSSGFNTGGGGWNTLEDWIDQQVCADTTYLVIGTYFESYTDKYGNSASPKKISFGGRTDVSCPTMFYIAVLRTKSGNTKKSVINCTADELKAAVFVRCHNNNLHGVKVSSKDMISVAELEKLTGHTFFTNVPNAPKGSYNPADWGL